MFSLKLLLITATVMMSVLSSDAATTTAAPTTTVSTNTTVADNTTPIPSTAIVNMNTCGPATLGANMPKSFSECQTALTGATCCFISIHAPANVTGTTAMDMSLCAPVPSDLSSTGAATLLATSYTQMGNGMTLNNFSCASSFVQVSAFLIAVIALLL